MLPLAFVAMSDCGLTGHIPTCVGSMTTLTELDLQNNHINGSLPALPTSLVTLNLRNNYLCKHIPESLCNLSQAVTIDLSRNSFTGSIPYCIGQLASVETLLLYTNMLNGTIPASFGYLTNVDYLDISVNIITGSIPPEFCRMTLLNQLYLSVNKISGTIDPCFGNLEQLAYIDFSNNLITGTIPDSFSDLTSMVSLSLGDNQLNGTVPSFASWTEINLFDISNNNLRGGFVDLGAAPQLQNLFLKGNLFYGTIPDILCNYTELQFFNVENNHFEGNMPDCIDNLQNLENLEISENSFSGPINPAVGGLSNLRFLRCGSNQFDGVFPASFANLQLLRWLDASSNPFNSQLELLSQPLYLLPDLMYLDLANTSSYGGITYPMFWMDNDSGGQTCFPSLVHADLHNNQLSGTIPSNINWWQRIMEIDLSQNYFEGTIPSTLRLFYNVKLDENPGLRSTDGSLPSFLTADYSTSVLNQTGNFHCPAIMSKEYPIVISIDPYYYNYSECECSGNFFGVNGSCRACLDNGNCPGGEHITVKPGYFPTPSFENPEELIQCVTNRQKFSSCNPDSDTIFACKEAFRGRKCAECISNHYYTGGNCLNCTGRSYILGTIVVIICLVIFTITLLHMRSPSKYGTFKILLLWGQIVSALLDTELPWPSSFTFFKDSVDVSSIGINGIFGFECMFSEPNSPVVRFYLSVITPLLLVGYDCVVFALFYIVNANVKKPFTTTKALQIDFTRFVVYSLSLFYFPVAKTVLSAFNCEKDPITHIHYLTASPYLECASGTVWSEKILPAAVVLCVTFVFGFPACLVYILVHFRKNLYGAKLQSTIGFLFVPFKKRLFYFGYVQLGRSLLLSIIIGILPETSTFRRLLILLSLLLFLAAQIYLRPYVHRADNHLEAAALMCLIVTYVAGLSFGSLPLSPDTIATSVFVITLNAIFVFILVVLLAIRFLRILKDLANSEHGLFKSASGQPNFFAKSLSVIMQVVPSSKDRRKTPEPGPTPPHSPSSIQITDDSTLFKASGETTPQPLLTPQENTPPEDKKGKKMMRLESVGEKENDVYSDQTDESDDDGNESEEDREFNQARRGTVTTQHPVRSSSISK